MRKLLTVGGFLIAGGMVIYTILFSPSLRYGAETLVDAEDDFPAFTVSRGTGVSLNGSGGTVSFTGVQTKPYIILNFSESACTGCVAIASGYDADTAFQTMITDPTKSCNFALISENLSTWLTTVGTSSFVSAYSYEGIPNGDLSGVIASFGLTPYTVLPHIIVVDEEGVEYPESQINTLCDQTFSGGSTGSGSTSAGTTTASSTTTSSSSTSSSTTSNTSTCENNIKDGPETDIDCGGSCPDCGDYARCLVDTDCQSNNCSLGFGSTDSPIEDDITYPSAPPSELYFPDRVIVKFTADENFYLPNFDETVLLNTKDKYLGYLIGKAVHEYVNLGTTSIPTLHTLDSIFNYAPERIERIFPLVDADNHTLRSTMRVTLPEGVLADEVVASLADTEGIDYIEKEPLYTVSANDSLLGSQRYITKTESDKARNAGAEGDASVVIAVIDNGFEITHPDLAANILPGRDAADNDSDPTPPSSRYSNTFAGHGTHTAGLAAAVTDNGAGIGAISHNVKVLPIKATSSSSLPQYVTDAYGALQYAISRSDVDVISMSFGGPSSQSMQSLIAAHPEKIYVAAAGNDGSSSAQYPAAYQSVYAVAASTTSDLKAGFSNYGSRVDIAAPGVSILATDLNGSYQSHDGTSSATPLVASLIGLLLAQGATDPLQIITQTAEPMPDSTSFTSGLLGAGRINTCKAVAALGIACTSSTPGGSTSGGSTTSSTTTAGTSTSSSTTSSSTTSSTTTAGGSSSAGSTTAGGYGYCIPSGSMTTTSSSTTSSTTSSTAGSTTSSNSTGSSTDGDGDTISNTIENSAPNNGDGNYDGVLDSAQLNVTSILATNTYATIDLSLNSTQGCTSVVSASGISTTQYGSYTYPYGLVGFTLSGCSATPRIRVYRHSLASWSTYQLHKQLSNGQIIPLSSIATNIVTGLFPAPYLEYTLPSQNGVIIDPVGIAVLTSSNSSGSSSTTGVASYPIGNIEMEVNDTTTSYTQTLEWTIDFSYTTYSPSFPLANGVVTVDVPDDMFIDESTIDVDIDGDYLDFDEDDDIYEFSFAFEDTPSSSNSTRRIYEGNITFQTTMDISASSPRIRVTLGCYDLESLASGYYGSSTCSTSSSVSNATTMDTDSVTLSVSSRTTTTSSSSSTTSSSTSSSSTTSSSNTTPVTICGNGRIDTNEECDDGNKLSGDGCESCRIVSGRKCTQQIPSQCGSTDCTTHGGRYSSKNIFGTCCGGLDNITVPKNSIIGTGAEQMTLCYDATIDQPICSTTENPDGRWIKKSGATTLSLIVADSCENRYKDYYKELLIDLQTHRQLCAFDDDAYEKVHFYDTALTKQAIAIDALKEFCVIKGIGDSYDTFAPKKRITRAEFVKMLVKLIAVSDGKTDPFQSEKHVYSGDTYFLDVSRAHRGAQYIAHAKDMGILSPFFDRAWIDSLFLPGRSVRPSEAIGILRRVPQGQFLSTDTMQTILGSDSVVTRAEAAEVFVKKFLPDLEEYFYFQGSQEEYYRQLAEQLRGKNYKQQYQYILEQIHQLENSTDKNKKLDAGRMSKFLFRLIHQ